jgi:hypothetical protein
MSMHDAWLRDTRLQGAHAWTLPVLTPLVTDGTIRMLDETDLFNTPVGTDCSAFFDFYHINTSGRSQFMQAISPPLQAVWIDEAVTPTAH